MFGRLEDRRYRSSAIGTSHDIFRKKFLAISIDPHRVEAEGISIKRWDFLLFGFVISSSVAMTACCRCSAT